MSKNKSNTNTVVTVKTNAVSKDAVKAIAEKVNADRIVFDKIDSLLVSAVKAVNDVIALGSKSDNCVSGDTVNRFVGLNKKLEKSRIETTKKLLLINKRSEKEEAKLVRDKNRLAKKLEKFEAGKLEAVKLAADIKKLEAKKLTLEKATI